MWDSATPTSVDFADGAYFHNFETLRYFATGSGNDSITQPPNIEKIIFLGSSTLPSLDIGPGQIVIVGGAAPAPAPPAGAVDSGVNEIARLQGMAGTVSDALPIKNISAAHDTTADIPNPTVAFHEMFAPDFTTDTDIAHDAWHHDAAPASFDFDVMDAMV